ncbi:hypothetical protein HRbin39_01212 [bacterium HR39]|nr:hypothetical protein HRbin39_01212 [bacterium HR39]
MSAAAANPRRILRVRVWDPFVRIFHWTVVTGVLIAYFTEDWRPVHKLVGYVVLVMVTLRIVWGFLGPRHARFSDFVRGPREVLAHVRDLLRGREPPSVGHNPLGGMMVVALLTTLLVICVSGWMMTLDAFWGDERVEELHESAVNVLLGLVGLHVAGVVFTSLREGVNLVKAMFTGTKEFEVEDPEEERAILAQAAEGAIETIPMSQQREAPART